MPAYARFVQNGTPIRGSVNSGAHMGWTELVGFELAPQASGRTGHSGGVNMLMADGSVRMLSSTVVATKATGTTSPARRKHFSGMVSRFSAGQVDKILEDGAYLGDIRTDPTDITVEVDFTAGHNEVTVLRTLIHGVRIVRREPVTGAGNDIAMEKVVIVHEGMTHAGASPSSPDITQQVRAHLQVHDWSHAYEFRTGKWG